jgi:hypothetical protein
MFQSTQALNQNITHPGTTPPPVNPTSPVVANAKADVQAASVSPPKEKVVSKNNLKTTLSSHGLLLIYLLSIFFSIVNLVIAFTLKSQIINLSNLKKTYQTQEMLIAAGLNQNNLNELGNLNNYFLVKEQVLAFIDLLNQQTAFFESLNYNFLGEEPAVSGQKYLPMAISAVGAEANTRELLEKIIGLPEPIEIIDFSITKDTKTRQSSLTIKLKIYVRDDFTF